MPFDRPLVPLSAFLLPWRTSVAGSDTIFSGLQFAYYPYVGIAHDVAKVRNTDSLTEYKKLVDTLISSGGFPGAQGNPTAATLWSDSITKDLAFSHSGSGVSGSISIWLWVYIASINSGTTDFCDVWGKNAYTNESTNQGWGFTKTPTSFGGDGTPRMSFRLFNNNGSGSYEAKDTTLALAAGQTNNYVGIMDYDPAGGGGNKFLYRDGALRVSPVGTGYAPSTAGVQIAGFSAVSPSDSFYVLGAGVWSRKLTAAEISILNQYPEIMLAFTSRPFFETLRPTPVTSKHFRRTLSEVGTRVGSRQMR